MADWREYRLIAKQMTTFEVSFTKSRGPVAQRPSGVFLQLTLTKQSKPPQRDQHSPTESQ